MCFLKHLEVHALWLSPTAVRPWRALQLRQVCVLIERRRHPSNLPSSRLLEGALDGGEEHLLLNRLVKKSDGAFRSHHGLHPGLRLGGYYNDRNAVGMHIRSQAIEQNNKPAVTR